MLFISSLKDGDVLYLVWLGLYWIDIVKKKCELIV